jgi:hypothetical protein
MYTSARATADAANPASSATTVVTLALLMVFSVVEL